MPRPTIDLTGEIFGRLVVRSRAKRLRGRTAWNCDCTCGRRVVVPTDSLRAGTTRSCGCAWRQKEEARLHNKSLSVPVTEAERAAILAHCESRGITTAALLRGFLAAAGLATPVDRRKTF